MEDKNKQNDDKNMKPVKPRAVYLTDEYTVEHHVLAEDGLPEYTFVYKPINIIQSANLTDAIITAGNYANVAAANIEMIADHMVSWTLKKEDGSPIDCKNPVELGFMSPKIIDKLISVVRHDEGSVQADLDLATQVKNS